MKYRLARTPSLSREAAALCQPRASAAPPWGTGPNTGLALKGQHNRAPGISAPFQGFPMHAHCIPRAALRLPWADLARRFAAGHGHHDVNVVANKAAG